MLAAALPLWPTTLVGMTLPPMVKIVNGAMPGAGRHVALCTSRTRLALPFQSDFVDALF